MAPLAVASAEDNLPEWDDDVCDHPRPAAALIASPGATSDGDSTGHPGSRHRAMLRCDSSPAASRASSLAAQRKPRSRDGCAGWQHAQQALLHKGEGRRLTSCTLGGDARSMQRVDRALEIRPLSLSLGRSPSAGARGMTAAEGHRSRTRESHPGTGAAGATIHTCCGN